MSQEQPIVFIEEREFLQNLPECFKMGSDNMLHHDPNSVNVISSTGKIFANVSRVLKVKTVKEVDDLKGRLFSNPIYMRISVTGRRLFSRPRTANFILKINSRHPGIAHQLNVSLLKAEQLVSQGRRFCLKIDFATHLHLWFARQREQTATYFTLEKGVFWITNFRRRYDWFYSTNATILIYLSPITSLFIGGYLLYRFIAAKDKVYQAKCDGAWSKTGPVKL